MVQLFEDQGWIVHLLESSIERACVLVAHDYKCKLIKLRGEKGIPDRMLLTPFGQMAFLEFKSPGKSLAPIQKHIQVVLTEMGFTCLEVDSVILFKQCLKDLLVQAGYRTRTKKEV